MPSRSSPSVTAPKILHLISDEDRAHRAEEHTSELQSRQYLVCRLLLVKKKHTYELQARQYLECRLLLDKEKEASHLVWRQCSIGRRLGSGFNRRAALASRPMSVCLRIA